MPELCLAVEAAARTTGLLVVVDELARGNFLERHRQVVLRARLHHRRRVVLETALAELVVVVVDLPRPLRRDDHQRVARVDLGEQFIDARMDHGRAMVAVFRSCPSTIAASASAARSRSSFSTTKSNVAALLELLAGERDPLLDHAGALGRALAEPALELLDRRGDEDRERVLDPALDAQRALRLELEQRRLALAPEAVDLGVQRPVAVADVVDPLEELARLDPPVELGAVEKPVVHAVLLAGTLRRASSPTPRARAPGTAAARAGSASPCRHRTGR